MVESTPHDAKRIRWWWIVLAAVIGVLLFAATGITQGACYDSSDPAASYCTSGTMIPATAVPYAWGAYILLAGFLIYLAIRSRAHH